MVRVIYNYKYKDGAREIIKYLQKKGYEIALLSGSIDLLVEKVAKELSIKFYGANNRFVFDNNSYLKKIVTDGKDSTVKVNQLRTICKKLGIKETDCVCVGDGLNDKELFQITKQGITFKGSRIEEHAWKTIDSLKDLRNIL
jgi:phosphoserine phosphatase